MSTFAAPNDVARRLERAGVLCLEGERLTPGVVHLECRRLGIGVICVPMSLWLMERGPVSRESDPDSLADLERPEFVMFEYMSETSR